MRNTIINSAAKIASDPKAIVGPNDCHRKSAITLAGKEVSEPAGVLVRGIRQKSLCSASLFRIFAHEPIILTENNR
ncbi:hypothetical protein HNQ34_003348 [Anoxybacillus tepidamans]|uniref:Uncharacterized protein n=1 Tax=Anoxybacteroides tepidamans TaxID=265948 RepID=A0A7W8IV38_9BACL|nr:hypothetical protein [Anoxybacillus tepidamans]MBB5326229.1 hypothetical protein [Anoxybacillus tepidamans]